MFQFNDYGYCLASNGEAPDYLGDAPDWVKQQGVGDAGIGDPVGCPSCHTWGLDNFEKIAGQ